MTTQGTHLYFKLCCRWMRVVLNLIRKMVKQKQKRLQVALVVVSLGTLSFMVGYWNGLIPAGGYKLIEETRKALKTSNVRGKKTESFPK